MRPERPMAPAAQMRPASQRATVLLLAVAQIVVTLLPWLGIGEPIGDRSDVVRTLITPAGWAFAIWGPLYVGSMVYALYQALPGQRANALLGQVGWYAAGAFAGNMLWALYTQSAQLTAISALIILFTLSCLMAIYRIFVGAPGFSAGERFLAVLPLSALAAWLTAASIVNIAASLSYHGVDAGGAAEMVGAAVIAVGGIIAAAALWRGRGNPWYALVFLWALAGIGAAGGETSRLLSAAVWLAALGVLLSSAIKLGQAANRSHWLGSGFRA